MELTDVLLVVARVLATFVLLMVVTVLNVWAERKLIADMQNRIGPNRAGPFGILQTVADGLKLFFKEQINPKKAQMGMFILAPFMAVIPAFLLFMVIPWGRAHRVRRRQGLPSAGCRPQRGSAVRARHVVDGGLRRRAGRLVVGFEVPAARWGASDRPGHQLRGGARTGDGGGGGVGGGLGRQRRDDPVAV
jgi:hypothetical protein